MNRHPSLLGKIRMRNFLQPLTLVLLAFAPVRAGEPGDAFPGEWRTTLGVVTLDRQGDTLTAKFAQPGFPDAKGKIEGKTATLTYKDGEKQGGATLTLEDSGQAFTGSFQYTNGQRGPWNGWRPDPEATAAKPGKFDGNWLTTLGLMVLEQDGAKVRGRYALRGTSGIEGEAKGRRLDYRYKWFREGKGWFDLAPDGATLNGAAVGDGASSWYGWKGRRASEFARHAKLVPGAIVDGSTENLLTYHVRAPEGYREGDGKRWPTVVILHGSNMNAKSYVNTLAVAWPEIARDFLIVGINGEMPSDIGADPRFNYTYVNYVGRSTYKGFPGTDRESPALVSEALTELKRVYPVRHYLVGGHSQGGFLTYSLLMNSPELLAGAFPISCGVIFLCEPGAYEDAPLRQAQRKVPLAIVHGKTDPMVDFGMSQYALDIFGDASWPALRLFTNDTGGHMFARLPVGEAIRWLEALASEDLGTLLGLAESSLKESRYRDAIAGLVRARALKLDDAGKRRADALGQAIDAKAKPKAGELLKAIRKDADGSWIEGFLAYRDEFEFADGAREVMEAFASLRAKHDGPAKKVFGEAQQAFRQGKRDEGYAKYQEIATKYYASSLYRTVKRGLDSRPR